MFVWGNISEPINAACPEPIPGRKEQRGADIAAAIDDFRKSFFGRNAVFMDSIFCLGSVVLFFSEIISVEIPKRPVSNGNKGSLIGRLNAAKPRNPARRNTINVGIISSCLKIRNSEMNIKRYGRRA